MIRKSISFRAQKDDEVEIRTESYLGRDHLVVPVVALVEGVLQGMNAETPELALTEEFGKVPDGWNGRPLVMNHPVVNGIPVSANSPKVLEEYAFGMLFNTRVEDNKLKTEAWIDLDRVAELGGEVETTVQRIQDNEVVEVSTGLFTGVEKSSGKFNGRKYNAIWRGIVPDHLAFLSEGVKGACSVEDGCGTPRVNAAGTWQEYKMASVTTSTKPSANGDCGCGCGGTCGDAHPHANEAAEGTDEFELSRLMANSIPDGLIDSDVRKLLQAALKASNRSGRYIWIVGFTADKVIYETYDYNDTYITLQRTYSIDDGKEVTLSDDITQVNLLTEIVPVSDTQSRIQANKESTTMADDTNTNQDPAANEVVDNAKDKTKMKDEGATPATPTDEPATDKGVKKNEAAPVVNSAPKVRTMSEYLGDMPEEMREVFQSGLKLHAEKKNTLIANLKASGRCKFSDDQLKAMNLDMLENLAELASVPSYEGTATPKVQSSADDDLPPPMPIAFPVKQSA